MKTADGIKHLTLEINKSLQANTFVKIELTNKRDRQSDLKKLFAKRVKIKEEEKLSFVFRHDTKDITKNFSFSEALQIITDNLNHSFYQATLFTTEKDLFFTIAKNGVVAKITEKAASNQLTPSLSHNKEKSYLVPANKEYLSLLGISNSSGNIVKDKHAKYRQINKFIELVNAALSKSNLKNQAISFVDMGCGSGYLTFALYDYLKNSLQVDTHAKGIERRKKLVDKCNKIANDCHFDDLQFAEGDIANSSISGANMLIALHACDTATDDAIAQGIKNEVDIIICSPCCHKQVRKSMAKKEEVNSIIQHGILKERQAEILTDTIRALIMEAHGYKTQVIEFISTEHTSKNLMIIGIKSKKGTLDKMSSAQEIQNLKSMFGIQEHYLETLV